MAINVNIERDPTNGEHTIKITLDGEGFADLISAHLFGTPSPLLILSSKGEPIKVDAVHYEFLCRRPGAHRFILDDSIYGVLVDGVTYHRAD